jgi:hypothetical protein
VITEPFGVVTRGDDYLHHSTNFEDILNSKKEIVIAVHVRRGDLSPLDRQRYLPDGYYREVSQYVIRRLKASGTPYRIIYYVDFPKLDKFGSQKSDEFSWDFALHEESFQVSIEEDAPALISMSRAEILIGSRSSYSFVAGLLSQACVFFPEWWVQNPSDWITIKLNELNYPQL